MLAVKLLHRNSIAPVRSSEGAAGYDLFAAEGGVIPEGGRGLVRTGISLAVPEGHYGRIAPRSGLSYRNGIGIGGGVIDSDYTGEILILLQNHGNSPFSFAAGDRVAQIILEKIYTPPVVVVQELPSTIRGENRFGSTGQ